MSQAPPRRHQPEVKKVCPCGRGWIGRFLSVCVTCLEERAADFWRIFDEENGR